MDLSAKARVFISIKDDGGSEDIILWVDSQELDKIEVAEIKRRIQDETGILATNIVSLSDRNRELFLKFHCFIIWIGVVHGRYDGKYRSSFAGFLGWF